MATQQQIFDRIKSLIPPVLWDKYRHLTFAEMAEINELSEWSDELRQAEKEWFEADDA